MVVFDNVVTLHDHTNKSLKAILSLDSLGVGYTSMALFPAIFHASRYHTELFDNQYLADGGVGILRDLKLSNIMFDKRNDQLYQYDGHMIDDIVKDDSASLYVVHLQGQHYEYKDRYPRNYAKYRETDYDNKYNKGQREVMAHYDNATIYNDYVVNKLIDKFENSYCCVFYLSDHGDEVYELRDFMGHGGAAYSPNLNYQLRIPLLVWFSPSFRADNPHLLELARKRAHDPICSDDIGHVLLDLAKIRTKDFVPARSFFNDRFERVRHRIVLNSIDYDDYWVNNR